MFINKPGSTHILYGQNCHDFAVKINKQLILLDGCSEGQHSEVGVKLFCHLFRQRAVGDVMDFSIVGQIFEDLIVLLGSDPGVLLNYLSFTILTSIKTKDYYYIFYCGDGFLIKKTYDGKVRYQEIGGDTDTPPFYIYNYINPDKLKMFKDGVKFRSLKLKRNEFFSVGLASDGLRYLFGTPFEEEFSEYLYDDEEVKLKRLINKHHKYFKDDITIIC